MIACFGGGRWTIPGRIAKQPGPFGEGAAVAVLAGGLPAEARFGLVAFAALVVGHLAVVAPGRKQKSSTFVAASRRLLFLMGRLLYIAGRKGDGHRVNHEPVTFPRTPLAQRPDHGIIQHFVAGREGDVNRGGHALAPELDLEESPATPVLLERFLRVFGRRRKDQPARFAHVHDDSRCLGISRSRGAKCAAASQEDREKHDTFDDSTFAMADGVEGEQPVNGFNFALVPGLRGTIRA